MVVEIDPDNLGEEPDYSCVRVIITRETTNQPPDDVYVGNDRAAVTLGFAFTIEMLRSGCAELLDEIGRLCPFFPRPPPPGDDFGNGTARVGPPRP